MVHPGGKVLWFRLRPIQWMLWCALIALLVGFLTFLYLQNGGAAVSLQTRSRGYVVMGFSTAFTGIFVIGATSRYWFNTLRHTRKP